MRERDRRRIKKLWGRRTVEAIAADLGVSEAVVLKEARRQRLPAPASVLPTVGAPQPARRVWGGLLLLSLAVYANNLPNAFVYDDRPAVVDNPAARDLSQTARIFNTASWWPPNQDARHYRPLTTFSYAANGSFTGPEPAGYHAVNNLLHGLCAGLVHAVLIRSRASRAAALLTSVIFVVHPLHVEAVSWVNGRADVLAGLFLLASLLAHVRARQERSGRWRAAAVAAFLAAGMSKETGYVTPFVLLAWDLLIGSGGGWPERVRDSLRQGWSEYLGHTVVLLFFAYARVTLVGGATVATVTPMASPLGDASFAERLATGSYVLARYLGLTLWPGPLAVDYSPNQITRLSALSDPRTLLGLVTLAACVAALAVAARRAPRIAFGLALAAIVMAPAANILFPIGTIMADRLMYLPLLAVAIPVAEGWAGLYHRGPAKPALAIATVLVAALALRTMDRNSDWRNDETLFRSALAVSPRSAMAHKNLAGILQERGENAQAAELAEQAVATVEAFPDAWLTLGNSYVGLGRYQEAVTAYRRALELRADHAAAYTNLAAALFFLGDAQGAVEASEQGLALDADQPAGWYNLIHFLAGAGRPLDAQQALQVAIARYPDYQARPEAEAKVRQAMQGIVANP